ncbi:MAG: S24/S26 family peptidase, partial [Sphingobacterium sp.]
SLMLIYNIFPPNSFHPTGSLYIYYPQTNRMDLTVRSEKVIPNRPYFQEVVRLLAEDKQVRIPVKGKSMQPFLNDGDLVVLSKFTGEKISLGSVVLGRYRDGVVLHRLVGRGQQIVTLAGDGNLIQKEKVKVEDILAIAISATRSSCHVELGSARGRLKGLAWYYLRWVRRVYVKLKRMIRV